MSKQFKKLRKMLATTSVGATCVYCGLPFDINPLKPENPQFREFANHAKASLEHLEAQSNGGATNDINCRLAHRWCNVFVQNLLAEQKAKLKSRLFVFVSITGLVPWVNKPKMYKYDRSTPQELERLNMVKGGKS